MIDSDFGPFDAAARGAAVPVGIAPRTRAPVRTPDGRTGATRGSRTGSADLDGRVALVACADGALGRAAALAFSHEGSRVVLMRTPATGDPHGARAGALERARAELESAGGRALVADGDPDDPERARDAVRRAIETWGALDALVLDSTFRRAASASAVVRASRPYLGMSASLASVVRAPGRSGAASGPALLEHASMRAARPGFARALLAGLAREGIVADPVDGPGQSGAFERLPPGGGALRGLGRHVLSLRDGSPERVAACLVHLARADADWTASRG